MEKMNKDKLKRTLNSVGKTIQTALYANGLYFATLIGTEFICNRCSEEIKTQTQMEQIAETERRKIDPKNSSMIEYELLKEDEGCSIKLSENHYKIKMGGSFANKTVLEHELYHILDGHFEESEGIKSAFLLVLQYHYWQEPQAAIYQAFGIKL